MSEEINENKDIVSGKEDKLKDEKTKKDKKLRIFSNFHLMVGITVVYVVFVLFFDTNNLQFKKRLSQKHDEVVSQRDSLIEQISADSLVIDGILNNDLFLEKYAREEFYMKQEGEDVFVVK